MSAVDEIEWSPWRKLRIYERIGAMFCCARRHSKNGRDLGPCRQGSVWVSSLGKIGRVVLCDEHHKERTK